MEELVKRMLPIIEGWLREIIHDEVMRVMEEERMRKRPQHLSSEWASRIFSVTKLRYKHIFLYIYIICVYIYIHVYTIYNLIYLIFLLFCYLVINRFYI